MSTEYQHSAINSLIRTAARRRRRRVSEVHALATGSTGLVEFKENGDAKGRYTIYQFQRLNATNTYKYVPIGSWTDR